MKKDNIVKLLAVALVVAIISTGLFYGLFVNRLDSATSGRTLVVAAHSLKPGKVLAEADVKVIPWPAEQLPKGAYQTAGEVVGSTVFDSITEQEPVLSSRLGSSSAADGVGVPQGMRAVSVHVSDSTGVMSLLRNGQRVDVQVVRGRGKTDAQIRTVLENVAVYSVTPQAEQSSQGDSLPVATLLVHPQDADVLAAADAGAHVKLILRNPADSAVRQRSTLGVDSIMRVGQ